MKWGMQAFDTFRVVPPGFGIVHQVNLEFLARGVHQRDDVYFPDSLVGTDSHTTMINGIGVVGWGVGGIEAEAAMLGQPVYLLTPDVIGVELKGRLRGGITATDLVLTVTEMLRKEKVVGKFVEFFGDGTAALSVPDRATIANMAPEYGATMGFFPVDEKTIAYFEGTGRTRAEIAAFEAYYRAQGLFGVPRSGEIDYTKVLTLDLASVAPSLAGPKRPQDRIEIGNVKHRISRTVQQAGRRERIQPAERQAAASVRHRERPSIHNGDVLIAAITSCTNTSNPSVLLAAGLLAKKAVEAGLTVASRTSRPRSLPVRAWSPSTCSVPDCCPIWKSSASTWPPTAARPASATPATWRLRSTTRSSRTIWCAPPCCRATATSKLASTRI